MPRRVTTLGRLHNHLEMQITPIREQEPLVPRVIRPFRMDMRQHNVEEDLVRLPAEMHPVRQQLAQLTALTQLKSTQAGLALRIVPRCLGDGVVDQGLVQVDGHDARLGGDVPGDLRVLGAEGGVARDVGPAVGQVGLFALDLVDGRRRHQQDLGVVRLDRRVRQNLGQVRLVLVFGDVLLQFGERSH